MQRETIAAASTGAGLLAGEGWRVSVTRMRKRLPRAKHYARHFPHIRGRPGRTGVGGNETLEARMPARTSEQISRLCQCEDRRWREVRSDFVWGLLHLASPCPPLFPRFCNKNCSHFLFLTPRTLLSGLGMPKARGRFGLRSRRCDSPPFRVKCVNFHIECFPHDDLRDMLLWKHRSGQSTEEALPTLKPGLSGCPDGTLWRAYLLHRCKTLTPAILNAHNNERPRT